MEYKKTTYEIIESYPNIIRHKVPLIQILMATIYMISSIFVTIYLLFKKGFSLFNKIEISRGAEDNDLAYHFDLETLEPVELEKDDVLSTESIYYSFKESIPIAEQLNTKGYNVFENVGKNYRIKKRIETCYTIDENKKEEKVIISVPRIAVTIHNIFNTLKLL